jgi:hypothetical protein
METFSNTFLRVEDMSEVYDEERLGDGKCLDFRDSDIVGVSSRHHKKGTISSSSVEKGLRTGGLGDTVWSREMADDMQENIYMSMTRCGGARKLTNMNLLRVSFTIYTFMVK